MKTELRIFQSGLSGMPGVSQNHDGSTKRRLQPILLLDEALGYRVGTSHRFTAQWDRDFVNIMQPPASAPLSQDRLNPRNAPGTLPPAQPAPASRCR